MSMDSSELSRFKTFFDALRYRAAHQPDKRAYIYLENGEKEGMTLTYGQLDRKARAIAAKLQDINAKGERALMLFPPNLEFIIAYFGCLYAGVTAVPIYPPRKNRSLERVEAVIKSSESTVALCTRHILSDIERRFPEYQDLEKIQWLETDELEIEWAESWKEPTITPETLAFLQYTSGSTGSPKGVMVSHGNLIHNQQMLFHAFVHDEGTIGVSWLPIYHDMGLIGGMLLPLYAGFPSYYMGPVSFLIKPIRWLKAIDRYRSTLSVGPNFAYDLCVKRIKPVGRQLNNLARNLLAVASRKRHFIRATVWRNPPF